MCMVLESVAALVSLIVMVSGIFISLVSVNVLGLWVGLEVNFLGAICFMAGDTVKESEGVMKYFIIQVVGSCFLLLGILTLVNWGFLNFSIFMVLSGSLIKLGCFPFHFWVPTVMSGLSWSGCFTLSVIQKIIPLWFLSSLMLSGWETFIMEVISCLSCVVGCLGGLGVLNYRVMLAYSSFVHLGFMLILTFVSVSSFWLYLMIYGLVNFFMMMSLASLDVYSFMDLMKEKNYMDLDNIWWLTLYFLSLAGLPPFVGFVMKAYFLLISWTYMPIGCIICLFSSSISLYYYLTTLMGMVVFWGKNMSFYNKTLKYKLDFISLSSLGVNLFLGFVGFLMLGLI